MSTTTANTHKPSTQETTNGIDVAALMQTLGAIKAQPGLGQFQFRATNRWLGGAHNRSQVQSFYGAGQEDDKRTEPFVMDCDEPPVLMGEDRGANPVEYVLNALAGCVTTTMVMHAASRGIDIESIESSLEGDIDIRGFTGLDPNVTKGYEKVRVTFRIKSDASAEQLAELARMSPVYNTVVNPTPVEIAIEKA